MNTNRMHVTGGLPSDFSKFPQTHPYYICAPGYSSKLGGTKALHKLCSALNLSGYEAYVETNEVAGKFWSPILTETTKAAHFQAGRKPIVVSAADIASNLQHIGLQVKFLQERIQNEPALPVDANEPAIVYLNVGKGTDETNTLFLPCIDIEKIRALVPLPQEQRTRNVFLHRQYTAAGGKPMDFGPDALDLSATEFDDEARLCDVLCTAKSFYCYEQSDLIDLARVCGCPVVLIPNALTLKSLPDRLTVLEKNGVAWGDKAEEMEWASSTVLEWQSRYFQNAQEWTQDLSAFVKDTQQKVHALTFDQAWPQTSVDLLEIRNLTPQEQGARADRNKYKRVSEQFQRWRKYCTIREIDADIYAEYLSAGKVHAVSVLIDQRGFSIDALADTLDSLSECLWQPANVLIVSDQPAPADFEGQSDLQWLTVTESDDGAFAGMVKRLSRWVLLVQSGTRLAAQSLVEWGLAIDAFPQAELIYADEDFGEPGSSVQHPFFKPDANIELLRCTNYLGNAVLARTLGWTIAKCPLFDGRLYGYALQLLKARGRKALGHIDTVLVHSNGQMLAGLESMEYAACARELAKGGLAKAVRPLARLGTWLVDYAAPSARCVSLVVPTGIQTGYMRSLLDSLQRYPQEALAEIILVCQPEQVYEVEYALATLKMGVPIQIVELQQESYNHSAALNAGIAQATAAFILVCDDDAEAIQSNWLSHMLGIALQPDVGCVAPRLLSNQGADARVTGGPMVLGIGGTAAPYNGEVGLLDECGAQSRLQLTQDVGTVAGHCFLFRKAGWVTLEGFDAETFGVWYPVLDFCLRLGRLGKRHVWTPLASVMHQGGKTIENLLKDTRIKLKMADAELTEKNGLLERWSQALAHDPCYNRHLSLFRTFDIESAIVIDWQPKRKDRPRVLACPLSSGAGQYRIVEPLNALQDASLAQTCVIMPATKAQTRILQPLELVRAAPDRLVLQHSVDDVQIGMIEKYKIAMPGIKIIQMVDDLLGDVPIKHPNRVFQAREGHQRMAQALKKSDRLIVTTETLKQHYQKYVADVWLIPNCIDKLWVDLSQLPLAGEKLRVGWIGAGQHKGDLELITEVVKAMAGEVDWVFMGMCTDEIRPHIKEYHGFVAINDYPKKMASLNLDIAIAPLESNFFNECKSNLRLLEYGAMGWAVVCSDVFPYRTMDPPVIRCTDDAAAWVDALRRLVQDEGLRHQMGEDLHAWVQNHFLLKNRTTEWQSAIFNEVGGSAQFA